MAQATNKTDLRSTLLRIFNVLRLKKKEINAIYFFALMYGILQLSIPLGIQSIVNFIQAYTFSTSLWLLIILVVIGVAISGGLQVAQMKIIERINQKIFARFGLEYTYHIPRLDMKKVDNYYLPELVNRFFDTVTLQKGLTKFFIDIPVASIQIIFGVLLLSFYSSVFIIFGILLLIVLILILLLTSNKGLRTSLIESDYKYAVASWLEEMARSIKTFKFSRGTPYHIKKSDKLITEYLKARTSHFHVLLVQYWSLIVFKVFITAAMLIVGTYLAINNLINLGQFIATEIVIIMIMNSVEKIIFSLDNVYDILTSVEKLSKILDKPEERSGIIELAPLVVGPSIDVSGLSYTFDNAKVLNDVSFNIPAGAKVCLKGQEGSGKSILLRLLSGSYSDFQGSINIQQIPINNYNVSSLRTNTGIILREQEIFDGTLLENITLNADDVPFSNLNHLASLFGFQQSFQALPLGYETRLDASGKRLNKSLIQKILLLRALVHQPHLLLLKDPWSSLSEGNKLQVQQYLINDIKATVIVATNEEDFAKKCNYIIELKDGGVVRSGTTESFFNG